MQKLSSNIKKQVRQFIKNLNVIPKYDYDKVLKQIEYASYPAGLGSINLILYQYMKTLNPEPFHAPQIFFLFASLFFFFMSILIGIGIGDASEEPLMGKREIKEARVSTNIFYCNGFCFRFNF